MPSWARGSNPIRKGGKLWNETEPVLTKQRDHALPTQRSIHWTRSWRRRVKRKNLRTLIRKMSLPQTSPDHREEAEAEDTRERRMKAFRTMTRALRLLLQLPQLLPGLPTELPRSCPLSQEATLVSASKLRIDVFAGNRPSAWQRLKREGQHGCKHRLQLCSSAANEHNQKYQFCQVQASCSLHSTYQQNYMDAGQTMSLADALPPIPPDEGPYPKSGAARVPSPEVAVCACSAYVFFTSVSLTLQR